MKQHAKHAHSYRHSFAHRIYSALIVPFVTLLAVVLIIRGLALFSVGAPAFQEISSGYLWQALGATLLRLLAAYGLALIFAIPLSLLINTSQWTERMLLPLFDIIQSVPALAFFPIIILFFIRFNFINGAAIFILFSTMLWNIVFSAVGGLKVIPSDIKFAAYVFRVRGFDYFKKIVVPAVTPYLVTGSILAWAQGWNIIIVAEVLHTYIPGGSASQDLFGIGSVLVNAASGGENGLFLASVAVMVVSIALLNFFIWQKLLHYAEGFKFE